jgi:hypothetical protein
MRTKAHVLKLYFCEKNRRIVCITRADPLYYGIQTTSINLPLEKEFDTYASRLGKKTLIPIKRNFFWAFVYNILMIPVVACALYPTYGFTLKPGNADIDMWLSSLSAAGNSLLFITV